MNADRLLAHYERIADTPDAIARLRRFILDLAVRGKLLPQDASDEPAWELLKRIAKEKARLVNAGEIARLADIKPAVRDDLSFEIPAHWQPAKIEQVLNELQTGPFGSSLHQSDYRAGGTPVINPASIQHEQIVPIDKMAVDAPTLERLASFKLRSGDIVMARRGEMGRCAIVRERETGWLCGTGSLILRPSKLVYANFLVLLIGSPFGRAYLGGSAVGTTMQNLNQTILLKLPFGLPPLAEQRRIVAKVDELMGLCDRLEAARAGREAVRDRLAAASFARLNAPDPETFQADARFALDALPALTARPDQIKRLRQTILNLAVRGKLVPQDPNDEPASDTGLKIKARSRGQGQESIEPPYGLPVGWAWRAIDTLADQVTDGEHATPPRITESQVPLVTAKNVREGFMDYSQTDWVSFETAQKAWGRCRPQVGDLLLVCVGATTGRLTVLREPRDMVIVRSVALIRPNSEVNNEYLERALRSSYLQQQIWASVKAAAQPCLYINRIQSLLVPLPPLAEQHRIVAKVDALMALCDRLEANLTASAATRRRLLDALLAEALAPADARELEAAE